MVRLGRGWSRFFSTFDLFGILAGGVVLVCGSVRSGLFVCLLRHSGFAFWVPCGRAAV